MTLLTPLLLLVSQAGPTDAECEVFSREMEKVLAAGDAAAFDARCDMKAALDIALRGMDAESGFVKGFRQGAMKSRGFSLGPALVKAVADGGSYRFLRVRRMDQNPRALFRLIQNGSVNYHDLHLAGPAGGPLRIRDIYIYLAGENLTDTYRRMFMAGLAAQPGVLQGMLGKENEYAKAMPQLKSFMELARGEDAKAAMGAFAKLPPVLQKDKVVLLTRSQVAVKIGVQEALDAFEDFRKAYPGDASLDLVAIDPLAGAMKYKEAGEAVERVEKSLGGDAYLVYLRGNIRLLADDKAQAAQLFERAVREEKTLAEPYWMLITASLEDKKYADTARWLVAVERDAGVELSDLKDAEPYADFVKSPEYKAWMESRKKK
jgi:hypothetical protein